MDLKNGPLSGEVMMGLVVGTWKIDDLGGPLWPWDGNQVEQEHEKYTTILKNIN